jgi:hypothetical protein
VIIMLAGLLHPTRSGPAVLVGPHRRTLVALESLVAVGGLVGTALLAHRRDSDPGVAAVMVGSAAINAVGEALLWRGVFLEEFPDDPVRGCLWPLAGLAVWHLAPQIVLPSRLGRVRFVLGAAAVGSASALAPGAAQDRAPPCCRTWPPTVAG